MVMNVEEKNVSLSMIYSFGMENYVLFVPFVMTLKLETKSAEPFLQVFIYKMIAPRLTLQSFQASNF